VRGGGGQEKEVVVRGGATTNHHHRRSCAGTAKELKFYQWPDGVGDDEPQHTDEEAAAIAKLVHEREAARKARDYAKADTLRDELKKLGHHVRQRG
jgi:cysteinyl-tRNA synthetase